MYGNNLTYNNITDEIIAMQLNYYFAPVSHIKHDAVRAFLAHEHTVSVSADDWIFNQKGIYFVLWMSTDI